MDEPKIKEGASDFNLKEGNEENTNIAREEYSQVDSLPDRNSKESQRDKIFTIGTNSDRTPVQKISPNTDFKDDISEVNSEVVLRTHSRTDKRRILSTSVAPTVYLSPRRTNSSQDVRSGRPKSGMKKNDSMVLNLVIPAHPSPTNNYSTSFSYDNIVANGNLKERHKHPTYSPNSNEEYPMYINGGHINRGYSSCDLTEGVLDILINTFSIFYALFNVTVGLAVYVADIIDGSHPTAEIFSLVLVSIACIYLLYLIIDISIFMNKKRSYEQLIEKNLPENIDITETPDGTFQFNIALPEIVKMGKDIKHDYCFNKDRHKCGSNLVAHSYDGTAVMAGHLRGLQAKVKEKFKHAIFVHCIAHILNLVLSRSMDNIKDCKVFFSTLGGFGFLLFKVIEKNLIARGWLCGGSRGVNWVVNRVKNNRSAFHPNQMDFYGILAWNIITHVSMPLVVSYRFQATVCFYEIWKHVYKRPIKPDLSIHQSDVLT
ncbi:unnamed protein product [Psylliodes chrysocephalus]|uniref:Uncharacterized protein n=1 Tax=Psylliodes chrysocephalus TaxID=3402493 RepID=A0A9P0GEN3_9CUCU|nr:unnamed protein product [Psylliodes chrysocephala]